MAHHCDKTKQKKKTSLLTCQKSSKHMPNCRDEGIKSPCRERQEIGANIQTHSEQGCHDGGIARLSPTSRANLEVAA